MLTMTRLDNRGQDKNGNAVLDYLKATEYYLNAEGQSVSSSQWMGKGANALGLTGAGKGAGLKEPGMLALAQGFAPDGTALCQNAGSAKRRIGYDFTFSADKSLSLVYAQSEPEERQRILDAHHAAVGKVFGFIEGLAETRRGKGGAQRMGVEGLVASRHTHFGSRDLDPQIHSHVLIYGVAQGADGSWGTFDPDTVLKYGRALGAMYRAELATNMKDLGYGIEKQIERDAFDQPTGDIYFNIAGVSEEMKDTFSKRRQAILDYHAENGGSFQQACMATRRTKDEPSYAELSEMWRQSLAENDMPSIERLKQLSSSVQGMTDTDIVKTLHDRKAVFTRADLIERVALENVGLKNVDQILGDVDRIAQAPTMRQMNARIGARSVINEQRYAADWMIELEQGVINQAKARQADPTVRVPMELVNKALDRFDAQSGFTLTAEQRQAVVHLTTGSGGLAVLTGLAGTGKTTVSKAYVDAFRSDGRIVIGASTGWDAAKKLEAESGIESYSTASLLRKLERGEITLTSKHVVVLDEAGMAGIQSISKLQKYTDDARGKLIAMGDDRQLQPIEAGGTFRLAKQAVGDARLTEIRRQKNKSDVQTTEILYNDAAKAFDAMGKNGQVRSFPSSADALKQMAVDYSASATPDREKLALVSTHSESKRLTALIRDHKIATGELHGPDVNVRIRAGRYAETISLKEGDRIRFSQKQKRLDVYNGTQGQIEKIDITDGAPVLHVRIQSEIPGQDGRLVQVNTDKVNTFSHGYAMTVHKSQGQGRKEVFQLANPEMTDQHSGLVGFTRMKESFRLYGGSEDLIDVRKRMAVERLKENALEVGEVMAPAPVAGQVAQRRGRGQAL